MWLSMKFLYYVWYGRVKPFVVVVVVSERISELISLPGIHQWHPPNKNIPTGDRQATWWLRPVDRVWDCSHLPSNVRQLWPVTMPPHTVNASWVWWCRPGGGRLGMWQLRPPGTHTSTVLWPSPSLLRPPVNNIAENKIYQVKSRGIYCSDWSRWFISVVWVVRVVKVVPIVFPEAVHIFSHRDFENWTNIREVSHQCCETMEPMLENMEQTHKTRHFVVLHIQPISHRHWTIQLAIIARQLTIN